MVDFTDILTNVHGFISLAEAELLYTLASRVPNGGMIVEIGSYQGRSAVCLGLGAKEVGALVYAIDPHNGYQIDEHTHYGMENHAALLKNLVNFNVADIVRVVALDSSVAWGGWWEDFDLLWIDGMHDYISVKYDFEHWSPYVDDGKIALHDTAGHHAGVTQLLNEVLAAGQWKISQQVDAITVLERAK